MELGMYWRCRELLLTSEPWVDPVGFDRLVKYIELCEGWYPGLKLARGPGLYGQIGTKLSDRDQWAVTHCANKITGAVVEWINEGGVFNKLTGVILAGGDVLFAPAIVKSIQEDGVLASLEPDGEMVFIRSTPHTVYESNLEFAPSDQVGSRSFKNKFAFKTRIDLFPDWNCRWACSWSFGEAS